MGVGGGLPPGDRLGRRSGQATAPLLKRRGRRIHGTVWAMTRRVPERLTAADPRRDGGLLADAYGAVPLGGVGNWRAGKRLALPRMPFPTVRRVRRQPEPDKPAGEDLDV